MAGGTAIAVLTVHGSARRRSTSPKGDIETMLLAGEGAYAGLTACLGLADHFAAAGTELA